MRAYNILSNDDKGRDKGGQNGQSHLMKIGENSPSKELVQKDKMLHSFKNNITFSFDFHGDKSPFNYALHCMQ